MSEPKKEDLHEEWRIIIDRSKKEPYTLRRYLGDQIRESYCSMSAARAQASMAAVLAGFEVPRVRPLDLLLPFPPRKCECTCRPNSDGS